MVLRELAFYKINRTERENKMKFINILKDWDDTKNEHYLNKLIKFLTFKRENPSTGKIHKHHIIPRSWDKCFQEETDNIVFLTPREHLFVHFLMTKAFPKNYFMAYAFQRLCHGEESTSSQVKEIHLLAMEKNRKKQVYSHPPEIIAKFVETKKKNGKPNPLKGRKCYNNGEVDKLFFEGMEEPGFDLGSVRRGKKKKAYGWDELTLLKTSLLSKARMKELIESGWRNSANIKGEGNASYGKTYYYDPITLKNYKIPKNETPPPNLVKGQYISPEVWEKRNRKISEYQKSINHWWVSEIINKNPEKIRKTAEWHRGKKRPLETRKKQSEAKKKFYENGGKNSIAGKKSAYHIKTLELRFFSPEETLPENFVYGNPHTKKFWFISPEGYKEKFRLKEAPEGWVRC